MPGVHLYSIAIPQELWEKVQDLKVPVRPIIIDALKVAVKEKGKDDGGDEGKVGA